MPIFQLVIDSEVNGAYPLDETTDVQITIKSPEQIESLRDSKHPTTHTKIEFTKEQGEKLREKLEQVLSDFKDEKGIIEWKSIEVDGTAWIIHY